jgi:hypothetical protein
MRETHQFRRLEAKVDEAKADEMKDSENRIRMLEVAAHCDGPAERADRRGSSARSHALLFTGHVSCGLLALRRIEKATRFAVAHVELDAKRPWTVVSSGLNALTNAVICSGIMCKVAFPVMPAVRALR